MKIGEFRSNLAVMIYCHGKSKCPYYLKASELSVMILILIFPFTFGVLGLFRPTLQIKA